jgi:uncharacterized protein
MHVDYWNLIKKYLTDDWGRFVYVSHVSLVTANALKIAKGLGLDQAQLRFIEEAAMLHDIGIVKVHAPEIGCTGELKYICHGVEGRKILESEGLAEHALVAERHTGVGISVEQIIERNLPLPQRDMLAVSLEEKIISWADLFYSKTPSKLLHEKTIDEAYDSIKNYGEEGIVRFREWEESFA